MALDNKVVVTKDGSLTLEHVMGGECYHSTEGAWLEARELYVVASGFQKALQNAPEISVLDIGLGLGYNAISTISAWAESSGPKLQLVSIELSSELISSLATGRAPWQANWPSIWLDLSQQLVLTDETYFSGGEYFRCWKAKIPHPKSRHICEWTVIVGDARQLTTLPIFFDFFWQDPFSPEKNPEMWSEKWFRLLSSYASPGAVLMSYSVARATRDSLATAGFLAFKIETPTRKRHWLRALKADVE